MPAENLRVAPVPEHLIGFRSNEEQLSAQDFVLKATTIERDGFVQALAPLIDAGEVAYIQPDNPELPAQKEILWRVAKGDRLRDRTSY